MTPYETGSPHPSFRKDAAMPADLAGSIHVRA